VAEQEVLGANCDELRTCAIRPSGIYGPGDPLILARVVTECDRGLLKVLIGDGTGLSENSYIDNVVEGHIKAALRLVPDSPVPGQAYFINDGVYCNNLEFFRPIIEGLGFNFPSARIPAGPMVGIASLWELAHKYLRVGRPQLLVMEMRKLTINQPCSIEKAQRELNYGPDVSYEEAMRRSLPYCREVLEAREKVDRPALGWWAVILGGLAALAFVSFHETTWASWSTHVLGSIPRCLYAVGFWVACLVHVHKGLKAVRLAEQAGFHETSLSWGWQTFILGFPSMNKLLGRIAQSRRAGRLGRPREYP
jgi:hypothetical protein